MTRRALLRAGSVGAATVGAVAAFPGLLTGLASEAPETSGAAAELAGDTSALEAGAATDSSAIVAHITDASRGQMSLFIGEREISYRDAELVQRLLRASAR